MALENTKAKSKNQKRRFNKRGRPRIEGRLREPNGRISRAKEPAQKVALEARARHYGLTPAQALDQRAQSQIGRLAMLGASDGLSRDQYEAGERFLEIRNDYRKSLLSPGAFYDEAGPQYDYINPEGYDDWALSTARRYSAALKAIQDAQRDNPQENLYDALQSIVIDDLEKPYLIGSLRLALNTLHRHFLTEKING